MTVFCRSITPEQRARMVAGIRARGAWNKKPRREVACACECGECLITPDANGRERRYIQGHQTRTLVFLRKRPYGVSPMKGRKASDETRRKLKESHLGKIPWNKGSSGIMPAPWNKGKSGHKRTEDERRQISETLKAKRQSLHLWKGGIPQRGDRCRNAGWKILRDRVYRRDRWTCQVCGVHCEKRKIICHHIIPVRHGGVDEEANLSTTCRKCHQHQEWLYGQVDYHWAQLVEHGLQKDNPKDNPRKVKRAA